MVLRYSRIWQVCIVWRLLRSESGSASSLVVQQHKATNNRYNPRPMDRGLVGKSGGIFGVDTIRRRHVDALRLSVDNCAPPPLSITNFECARSFDAETSLNDPSECVYP